MAASAVTLYVRVSPRLSRSSLSATGTFPNARAYHSAVCANGMMYVFGGFDGTAPLNSIFVLDTSMPPFPLRGIQSSAAIA